jgi:hypothetical protein
MGVESTLHRYSTSTSATLTIYETLNVHLSIMHIRSKCAIPEPAVTESLQVKKEASAVSFHLELVALKLHQTFLLKYESLGLSSIGDDINMTLSAIT